MAKTKTTNAIEDGYREVAQGAQRLAEAIDILLPALIRISAGHGDPRSLSESALQAFETHSGQRIDRGKYMRARAREEAVAQGAQLAAKRAAGVVP